MWHLFVMDWHYNENVLLFEVNIKKDNKIEPFLFFNACFCEQFISAFYSKNYYYYFFYVSYIHPPFI